MEPQIRILQRPCPVPSETSNTPERPPVVTKTLEQREADYAAARRRIMGSDTSEVVEFGAKDSPPPQNVVGVSGGCMFRRDSAQVSTRSADELDPKYDPNEELLNACTPENLEVEFTQDQQASDSLMSATTEGTLDATKKSRAAAPIKIDRKPTAPSTVKTTAVQNGKHPVVVVNVGRKAPTSQDSCRQNTPQQQRTMLQPGSSPSFFHSNRHVPVVPVFIRSGYNNVGLLPTPGFQPSMQNGSSISNQSTNALTLLQQFHILQQQYQHTINGLQNQLVVSGSQSINLNPLNFCSSLPYQSIIHKYSQPPFI